MARKAAVTEAPAEEAGAEVTTSGEVTSLAELRDLLAGDDRPIKKVRVIEWPNSPTFYVRGLSGHDRDAIENTTFGEGVNDISAKVVARGLVKPDGTALVPKAELAAVERMLSQRSAGGLLRLQRIIRRLSRMDNQAIEELESFLKDTPSAPSGTD